MLETSATWKALYQDENAWLQTVAVINGTEYYEISNPVINRALMQNGLSVGNVVSATCQFSVRTDDTIPKSAEVLIKMRYTNGTQTSEWLPAGTFYISHRQRDPVSGILSLECYDALLKANAEMPKAFPWTNQNNEIITNKSGEWIYFSAAYPRQMNNLLNDIAYILGVELDSRTSINTEFSITAIEAGSTINDVLSKIASANGGNFIMTPENKLRLVKVVSADAASDSGVEVDGVIGAIGLNGSSTITGLRCTIDETTYMVGNDSGLVIDVDATQEELIYLGNWMIGMTYQPYTLSNAVYNPAIELGDYINRRNDIHSVLIIENATLGVTYRGDISAPEPGELSDEFPYIGKSEKSILIAKAYAEIAATEAVNSYDESLDQETVFNKLTDDGVSDGMSLKGNQIEFNASRIATGYLSADRIEAKSIGGTKIADGAISADKIAANAITADMITTGNLSADRIKGGTLTLGGLDNINGLLEVLDANGNVIGTWNNNGVTVSKGTISGPQISIGGVDNEDGSLTVYDSSGNVIGTWNNNGVGIYEGTININNESGTSNDFNLQLGSKAVYPIYLKTGQEGTNYNIAYFSTDGLGIRTYNFDRYCSLSTGSLSLRVINNNNARSPQISLLNTGSSYYGGVSISPSYTYFYKMGTSLLENWLTINAETSTPGVSINGYFSATGTKSRIVTTDQYSDRLLYCYETPSPMFGDVGEGTIGEDGKCYIWLDPVFAQTITTTQYQVFLQRYVSGECWVAERNGSYFVVEGTPGMAFGWELKAKQRDFDQKRLERNDEPFTVPTQTYGEDAARYIDELKKERIPS